MGKLSYEYKLPGRSIPQVHGAYEDALTHHQRARRVKYNGKKLSGEAFTNAIVLHFLDLSLEEQERLLAEYVPRFETLVGSEGEEEGPEAPAKGAAPGAAVEGKVIRGRGRSQRRTKGA